MTRYRPFFLRSLILALGLATGAAPAWAQDGETPARMISRVADNLYQARDSSHSTVFLVTQGGVILADPLNRAFAEWLKVELETRFNATVQYVIYSHHHWDHASGGSVFAETALFVGHEAMVEALARELPLYGPSVSENTIDANSNGRADRRELARIGSLTQGFSQLDTNSDEELSGEEINVDIRLPEIVYSDHMKITLADQTVELIHSHAAHSDDMTVLHFPQQRVAFAVDYVNVRRLPGPLFGFAPDDFIQAVDAIYDLDIDVFVPGHGNAGTGQDLSDYADLFQDLQATVSDGIERGLTLSELQDTISLDDYSGWLLYEDRRETVIADVYDVLRRR